MTEVCYEVVVELRACCSLVACKQDKPMRFERTFVTRVEDPERAAEDLAAQVRTLADRLRCERHEVRYTVQHLARRTYETLWRSP